MDFAELSRPLAAVLIVVADPYRSYAMKRRLVVKHDEESPLWPRSLLRLLAAFLHSGKPPE